MSDNPVQFLTKKDLQLIIDALNNYYMCEDVFEKTEVKIDSLKSKLTNIRNSDFTVFSIEAK